MLTSFKTRPTSCGTRPVPCGGLGGCVEVVADNTRHGSTLPREKEREKIRKKPGPIVIYESYRPINTSSCTRPWLDGQFSMSPTTPKTPKTPRKTPHNDGLSRIAIIHADTATPSPYQLWEKCKDNPWLATEPRKALWPMISSGQATTLAELPGSLLLPSQGFHQTQPPTTPPRLSQPIRIERTVTVPSPMPSLTFSSQSTPEPLSGAQQMFGSPLTKRLPQLPEVSEVIPTTATKAFTLMAMEELLQVLAILEADDIQYRWMPAMEKELSKLRAFVSTLNPDYAPHRAALRPLTEELTGVLQRAESICHSHTEEFRRAQRSTDPKRESDLVKIVRVHNNVRKVTPTLPHSDSRIQHDEFTASKTTLLECLRTLSGFVRNQMTFHLHQQRGGLSGQLIQTLRDFDCDGESRYAACINCARPPPSTTETQPAKCDQPALKLANLLSDQRAAKKDTTSIGELAVEVDLKKPTVQMFEIAQTKHEFEDIIDSYFDCGSSSGDSDEHTNEKTTVERLCYATELEKKIETEITKSRPYPIPHRPRFYQQHQYQRHQAPQPQSHYQAHPQSQPNLRSITKYTSPCSPPSPPLYSTSTTAHKSSLPTPSKRTRPPTSLRSSGRSAPHLTHLKHKISRLEAQDSQLRSQIDTLKWRIGRTARRNTGPSVEDCAATTMAGGVRVRTRAVKTW